MGGFFRARPRVFIATEARRAAPAATGEFAAPLGGRVRWLTGFVVALLPACSAFNAVLHFALHLPSRSLWPMVLAPLVGAVVLVPVVLFSRILGYRIVDGTLEVQRHGRVTRFALAGLESVTVDPQAMRWSLKLAGNDGAGAITGWYRNKHLGRYRALVTDRARAVVLRWPNRCLVVSPDRPQEFAAVIRAQARLGS